MIVLALLACHHPSDDTTAPERLPDDFLWGTAVAGFQVEAGCPTLAASECEDPNSDWYQFVTDPEFVGDASLYVDGDALSTGPGMWETFEDDADRMQADGMTSLRLGVEWSRLFPSADAEDATTVDELTAYADPAAVARYHAMLAALRSRGIEPLVTINHYTLPLWVHDGKACHEDPEACTAAGADGWVTGDRIVPLIALYAGFVGRELGDEVDLWATLNEPLAVPMSGYLLPGESRSNPPGLSGDTARTVAVVQNEIVASAAMYDAVHQYDTVDADGDGEDASVGIVMNMVAISPRTDSDDDARGADHMDHLYHGLFLDGLTAGSWDDDVDGTWDRVRPELQGRLDWVGVNYYATVQVAGAPFPLMDGIPVTDFVPDIDWYPAGPGMQAVLGRASSYGLPVYVTENGLSDDDQDVRVSYLEQDLQYLQKAVVEDGDDVRGYFYWSYIDNYEWNHGTGEYQFGMYGLDPDTKDRVRRPILDRYDEIIADHGFAELP